MKAKTSPARALALTALAVVLLSCTRGDNEAIVFESSGVSLAPGNTWTRLGSDDFSTASSEGICLPALRERGGDVIQVISFPDDRTDPQRRAASFRSEMDRRPDAVKNSFVQNEFTARSGLSGVHISYDINEKEPATTTRTHWYIVMNGQRHCVGILYVTSPKRDSDEVHRMISKTLLLR